MTLLRDDDLSAAFNHGSLACDRLVAVNPGYRSDLRRSARRLGLADGGRGMRLLDLGCRTGASTAALLKAARHAEIVAVDASAGMLERAAAKCRPANVTFVHAPVEAMDESQVHGSFDAAFAAYLFRNVSDPDQVLAVVRDLLVPGGRLAVHEFTLDSGRVHRAVWSAVCGAVVVPGRWLTGVAALYRHLRRSFLEFDTATDFASRLRRGSFGRVRVRPRGQTGITHTFVAQAPGAVRDQA
ncbi:methyltransferase [Streptomyces sp. NPDC057460]|uniref:methyltransferase n=1 Tax=Streptomyces sp. NPDC057460 TaxID=3346141 RepID=UPI0036A318B1